jgi:hypothetical protein
MQSYKVDYPDKSREYCCNDLVGVIDWIRNTSWINMIIVFKIDFGDIKKHRRQKDEDEVYIRIFVKSMYSNFLKLSDMPASYGIYLTTRTYSEGTSKNCSRCAKKIQLVKSKNEVHFA